MFLLVALPGCGASLAQVDGDLFPKPPRDTITFWGHACAYIDVQGYGIVTDPVFETQLAVRRRKVPRPPEASYAGVRIILISHAHDDHLNTTTLATFPAEALVLCPEPSAAYMKHLPQTVRVMRLGDVQEFPGGRVIAVAADHPGGRYATDSKPDGRALGYVIETPQGSLYYSGDTHLFDGFDAVARDYHPRVALLNINGHLHGSDAVAAAVRTRAERVLPLHYGAYGYFFIGEQKEPRSCEDLREGLGPGFRPLALGESVPLRP